MAFIFRLHLTIMSVNLPYISFPTGPICLHTPQPADQFGLLTGSSRFFHNTFELFFS
ncbi:hypothetical protein Scep_022031 [Stephania cephalantha]|uniref:Uncharacterized protein n=1 Tax=Stephania cephalantha TaxID=152367 RepID=A0AAP0F786_9MAGN